MKFFVVQTLTGKEMRTKKILEKMIKENNLSDKFGSIVIPVEKVWRIKEGKKKIKERKLYPGHILVEMEPSNETFKLVSSTAGVIRILGSKVKSTSLTDEEAKSILEEMEHSKGKVIAEVPFKRGENVKIIGGPFVGFVGVVDEINLEREKAKVLITIFGRSTPVELDIAEIETL